MKQKVKLQFRNETVETGEFDVEFPVYRSSPYDHSTVYSKRISPTETIDVHVNDDGSFQIEISESDDMRRDFSHLDYHLGRGIYKSSAEEFERALAKAKALMARF